MENKNKRSLYGIISVVISITLLFLTIINWESFYSSSRYDYECHDYYSYEEEDFCWVEDNGNIFAVFSLLAPIIFFLVVGVLLILSYKWKRKPKKESLFNLPKVLEIEELERKKEIKYLKSEEKRETSG